LSECRRVLASRRSTSA